MLFGHAVANIEPSAEPLRNPWRLHVDNAPARSLGLKPLIRTVSQAAEESALRVLRACMRASFASTETLARPVTRGGQQWHDHIADWRRDTMRSTTSPHDPVSAIPFQRATGLSVSEYRRAEVGRITLKRIDNLLRDFIAQCRTLSPSDLKALLQIG